MVKRFLVTIMLLLATTACTRYHKEIDGNPPFAPHHFRYYDVEIAWRAEPTNDGFRLTGTVTNRRDYYLRDLELAARLMNERGVILTRADYAAFPHLIPPGDVAPFEMQLRLPPNTRSEQVRFTYVYWLTEAAPELRGAEDVPHFGSFDAPL